MLEELQAVLVRGTRDESGESGSLRSRQVVIGRREEAPRGSVPVHAARFVPSPPGLDLRANLRGLLGWMADEQVRAEIDPVVAAALAHYQFETLHPFHDGNGRIGRLLIVAHLLILGVPPRAHAGRVPVVRGEAIRLLRQPAGSQHHGGMGSVREVLRRRPRSLRQHHARTHESPGRCPGVAEGTDPPTPRSGPTRHTRWWTSRSLIRHSLFAASSGISVCRTAAPTASSISWCSSTSWRRSTPRPAARAASSTHPRRSRHWSTGSSRVGQTAAGSSGI